MCTQDWPRIGQFVDFKNRDQAWEVAYILARTDNYIKIRCEGWAQKYDEIIPLSDQFSIIKNTRIQPFRSMVRGYTGVRKNIPAREHWKYSRSDHQLRLQKLDDFTTNLNSKTAQQLIQFLRGEHYFYVDFLMNNTYAEMKDLLKVYQYFFKHITLLQIYLQRILHQGIQSTYINIKKPQPSNQEETLCQTLDFCYYEIVQAMFNISGLQERLHFFIRSNEANIKEIAGQYQKHQYYVCNQIMSTKLFNIIIDVITHCHKVLSNSEKQIKLPFSFCFSLFQLFQIIQQIFMLENMKQKGEQVFDILFQLISRGFEELQPNDMKQTQIDRQIQHILSSIRIIASKYNREDKFIRWPEQTRMRICMLYLRCDKLERKLRGVTKLKEIAQTTVKEQYYSFNQQNYSDLLHQTKCFQELFTQNQHIQIYKKSIELISLLYKYDMITVDQLCFIWNTTINKHGAIVTILFQFWIQMAYAMQIQDLNQFSRIAILSLNDHRSENSQYQQFFFDLILAILNNSHKNSQNRSIQKGLLDSIDKLLQQMIKMAYFMLIKSFKLPFNHILVSKYGNIVLESNRCSQIIQEVYLNLLKKNEYHICLQILHQVYVGRQRLNLFVPQNIKMGLIQCIKHEDTTLNDIGYMLAILYSIFNLSSKYILKNNQLLSLWEYFRAAKQDFKNYFYEWMLPIRSDEIHDNSFSPNINASLSYELKRYLLSDILDKQQYINYSSLTKRQMSIILQLFIQVNTYQNKIQKKKLFEHHNRNISRIKTIQLTNQNILWKVFQKCRQTQVVHYVCRYLIKFYFYFSPSLNFSLRKSRIDYIMERILNNIRQCYQNGNLRLLRQSLMLLKYIFQTVKQDDRPYYLSEQPSPCKLKLQVRYQNNSSRYDVAQNETVLFIKQKIGEKLKLKINSFKLLNKQDDHFQELDYTYKGMSIGGLRKYLIQVIELQNQEENISKFVASYINQEIQNLLIKMLENQAVATQVFLLIEELDLKIDKVAVLQKINLVLQRLQKFDAKDNKTLIIEIYYHFLEIKLYNKLFQKQNDIVYMLESNSIKRILNCTGRPIIQGIQFSFLQKVLYLITAKIIKKTSKNATQLLCLPKYLFSIIIQISNFQLMHKNGFEHGVKQYSVKIIQLANNQIQYILGQDNMINFYVNQPQFSTLIQTIYLHSQIQQIRMFFTERLSKYLTCEHIKNQFNQNIEKYLLNLFIDNMYFKVKQKQISSPYLQVQCEGVMQFCIVLAKIISNVDANRFDNTQIIETVDGRSVSLFQACIQFIYSLKLFCTQDFHWNYLLSGHFQILTAIYQSKPTLIRPQIITFVLENCLALNSCSIIQPLCKKLQYINEAFKFLQQILNINKNIECAKLFIETIQPCHRIDLWRTSSNWSINVRQQPKQKFRGLINPGCICYMNSLLQQLYMIKEFRLSVLDTDTTSSKMNQQRDLEEEDIENKTGLQDNEISSEVALLQGFKQLLLKLQFSDENTISPTNFAKTLKTFDKKQMIKFNQQMDIDQFQAILFQKIEKGLSDINCKNFVKQLFGGVYAHQIISKQCSHKSERQEQFISMSLQVKENVIKSFQSLVKTQLLDGGNKYHCQKCDKKVKAQKVQTIKKLPPYLILCLKRFQFDYDIDTKIKINDYCQFPHQLNLLQFSQQQILKNKSEMHNEEEMQPELPPAYFDYQLRGVVVHTGSADSGHYYSLIDNNGTWYQFNDQQVLTFDINKIGEESFGCRSHRYEGKTKNAYLLIYQRKTQKDSLYHQLEDSVLNRSENKLFIDKIIKKNRQIRKYQIVFSDQYDNLIRQLQVNIAQIDQQNQLNLSWFQFYLSYYFLVKARKENYQYFMVISKTVERDIKNNNAFCNLFLSVFASPKFIQEFFVYNPIREKCRILAHIFGVALQKYYDSSKSQQFQQNQLLNNIFRCFKAVFISHSPISQLVTIISKFVQSIFYQNAVIAYKVIEYYGFDRILFNFAMSIPIEKKIKIQNELYCRSKAFDIPFMAPIPLAGKKFNTTNCAQIWKFIAMLLNLNNQFIQDPANFQFEVRDLYLNTMKHIKDCLNEPNIQGKIINIILDISNYRAIYYFYQAMKQLKFNLKILIFIQKALKDYQSIKYRPYFTYIQNAINDTEVPNSEKQKILIIIEKAYRFNQKFFLQMDIIHQWILRLVSMNEQFLSIVQSRGNFIQQMYDRITRNPFPMIADLCKKFKHQTNERLLNRYLGILVATEARQYEINSLKMKKQFDDIRNYRYNAQKKYHPPIDGYLVGQQIQFFDFSLSKWRKGKVIQNNFGQLTIVREIKDETHIFLWQDSEKLRSYIPNQSQQAELTPAESDVSYQSESSQFGKRK